MGRESSGRWRLAVVAAAMTVALACGGSGGSSSSGGSGGSSSSGGGSSSGAASGVPSGFSRCPQSGDVTKISDRDTAGEWQYQQQHGATGGDIEVYAASSADCKGMPDIRKGPARLIASAVINFKDEASAQGAGGVFGVSSSGFGSKPGAAKGSASGFGANGVYAYASDEAGAYWVSGKTVVAVLGENVAEGDFKAFANAVKAKSG